MAKRGKKTASEAVSASMAKARAEGRVRLSGYLSVQASEIVDRLGAQHGSRNAAIEAALKLADDPMSDDALIAALTRRLKGRGK